MRRWQTAGLDAPNPPWKDAIVACQRASAPSSDTQATPSIGSKMPHPESDEADQHNELADVEDGSDGYTSDGLYQEDASGRIIEEREPSKRPDESAGEQEAKRLKQEHVRKVTNSQAIIQQVSSTILYTSPSF